MAQPLEVLNSNDASNSPFHCFRPLFYFSPNHFRLLFHFSPNLHFSPKRLSAAARFEPLTSRSNSLCIRPQDHGVLLIERSLFLNAKIYTKSLFTVQHCFLQVTAYIFTAAQKGSFHFFLWGHS